VMIEQTPEVTTGGGRTQSEVVPTNMPRVLRTPPSSYEGETIAGGFAESFHRVYQYVRAAGSVCVLSALQWG
jgi:glycerol-3-phosphate responsive antiterminator